MFMSRPVFAQSQSQPASAEKLLQGARIEEEMGYYDRALAKATAAQNSTDTKVAAEARALVEKMTKLLERQKGAAAPGEQIMDSPVERRLMAQVQKYNTGKTFEFRTEVQGLGPAVVPAIAKVIRNKWVSEDIADQLVVCVQFIGGDGAFLQMREWIDHPDTVLAAKARQFLFGMRCSSELRTATAEQLLNHPEGPVRASAVHYIAQEKLAECLPKLLKDTSHNVRSAVVRCWLSQLDAATVEQLAKDPAEEVRADVAEVGPKMVAGSQTLIAALLADRSDLVREKCLGMLINRGFQGLPEADGVIADALAKFLHDGNDRMRESAVRAARVCKARFLSLVLPFVLDTKREVVTSAITALQNYSSQEKPARSDVELAIRNYTQFVKASPLANMESAGNAAARQATTSFGRTVVSLVVRGGTSADARELLQFLASLQSATFDSSLVRDLLFNGVAPADAAQVAQSAATIRVENNRDFFFEWIRAICEKQPEVVSQPAVLDLLGKKIVNERDPRAVGVALRQGLPLAEEMASVMSLEPSVGNDEPRGWDSGCAFEIESGNNKSHRLSVELLVLRLLAYDVMRFRNKPTSGVFISNFGSYFSALERIAKGTDCDLVSRLLQSPTFRANAGYAMNQRDAPYSTLAGCFSQSERSEVGAWLDLWKAVPDLRPAMIDWMSAKWGDERFRLLIELGLADPADDVRGRAIGVLQENRYFEPAAISKVTEAALDTSSGVRSAVLQYLASWNDPRAVPTVQKMLKDESAEVRRAGARAIGRLLSADAAPDLLPLLGDPDDTVRKAASDSLNQIRAYHEQKDIWENWYKTRGMNPQDGVRRLLEMMDDQNADVRAAAIESLATLKAKDVLPTLVERLKKLPAGSERDAVARAIAKLNQ
jgi:HEAT repeat protein